MNGVIRPSQFNASFLIARPTHFFGKVKKKKKIIDSLVQEASALINKHMTLGKATTLFSFRNLITSAHDLLSAIVDKE